MESIAWYHFLRSRLEFSQDKVEYYRFIICECCFEVVILLTAYCLCSFSCVRFTCLSFRILAVVDILSIHILSFYIFSLRVSIVSCIGGVCLWIIVYRHIRVVHYFSFSCNQRCSE